MKLRILGNSIRLRLSRTEVRTLHESGMVAESISFGFRDEERLVYSIESDSASAEMSASLRAGALTIRVPASWVERWASTNQVSLRTTQPIGDGRSLLILVEKDFKCLSAPREDEDAFPHPSS